MVILLRCVKCGSPAEYIFFGNSLCGKCLKEMQERVERRLAGLDEMFRALATRLMREMEEMERLRSKMERDEE